MTDTNIKTLNKKTMQSHLKDQITAIIDNVESLTDEEILDVLNSIIKIGWKQQDGFWRKL